MAKLIIKRKKELVNSMRDIELFLDRSALGSISNGKTEVFDLEPGTYNLKAEIDWCGSRVQEVKIAEGEVKTIELSAYKHSSFLFPALIIAGVLGVVSANLFQLSFPILLLIIFLPALLFLFYHITFGKDEYLQLKPID